MINLGCLLYKDEKYMEACLKYNEALKIIGYNPELCYHLALCYFKTKQYVPALKHIADIIEKGIREHPGMIIIYKKLENYLSFRTKCGNGN